jgi:hypothetical protein
MNQSNRKAFQDRSINCYFGQVHNCHSQGMSDRLQSLQIGRKPKFAGDGGESIRGEQPLDVIEFFGRQTARSISVRQWAFQNRTHGIFRMVPRVGWISAGGNSAGRCAQVIGRPAFKFGILGELSGRIKIVVRCGTFQLISLHSSSTFSGSDS